MVSTSDATDRMWGWVGAIWGLGGVLALLGFAVYRFTEVTFEALDHPFDWWHWSLLVAIRRSWLLTSSPLPSSGS